MDNSKEITLTAEGRQKLVDELAYREGELRDEIVERLKEARSFGDLSENSEYDAAKEEQSQNESKIVELEDERGKKTKFTIVGTTETNSLEHKISNESPAGQALIGCGKGDQVEFTTPTGKSKSYTVVSITR